MGNVTRVLIRLFQTDPTVKYTRKEVSRRDSVKVSEAKAWMTGYFNRIGDSVPHMDQVYLKHGLTKRDYMMKGQLLEQGINMAMSLSHFYTTCIWDTSFKSCVRRYSANELEFSILIPRSLHM